ncbi:MAG: class I SAM-dependent methyltransferase [archaeon]
MKNEYKLKPLKQKFWDIFMFPYHYKLNKILLNESKDYDLKDKIILEIGSGIKSYKHNFKKAKVITTDLIKLPNIDEVADIMNLKYVDNSFDFIICNNVFEHLSDPNKAANEIYRVLKQNGEVFIVTPFLFPLHDEPFDFFRYTSEGLKIIFNMFKSQKIKSIKYLPFFNKFVLYYIGVFRK